jgi:hypothetical protein
VIQEKADAVGIAGSRDRARLPRKLASSAPIWSGVPTASATSWPPKP